MPYLHLPTGSHRQLDLDTGQISSHTHVNTTLNLQTPSTCTVRGVFLDFLMWKFWMASSDVVSFPDVLKSCGWQAETRVFFSAMWGNYSLHLSGPLSIIGKNRTKGASSTPKYYAHCLAVVFAPLPPPGEHAPQARHSCHSFITQNPHALGDGASVTPAG